MSADRDRLPKLLVLQTHPIQYYAPIFRTLARRGRISVKVVYLTDVGVIAHHDPGFARSVAWDVDLLDGYEHRVLRPNSGMIGRTFWNRHDSRLSAVLAEERPDWIMLYGYASRMNWITLQWAKRHGVAVAYYSDSNVRLVCQRSWVFLAKRLVLQWYFSRVDGFLSPGEANRGYLKLFGADDSRIHWCPFAIDVDRFRSAQSRAVASPVDFVWAGKMVDVKRPIDFVNALAELVRRGRDHLTARMIGSGPLFEKVQEHAARVLPAGILTFSGFVNQSRMPVELCRGSVFVFTSHGDAYGMVVTEAAACGRALIVADVNGCVGASGSAQQGLNALTYQAGDVRALTDCMDRLLASPQTISDMQRVSAGIAAGHDLSRAADVVESLVVERFRANA